MTALYMNEAGRSWWPQDGAADVISREQSATLPLCYPDGRPMPPGETPLQRALRGDTVIDCPVLAGRPDGHDEHLLFASTVPVRLASGEIGGAVAVYREATRLLERE